MHIPKYIFMINLAIVLVIENKELYINPLLECCSFQSEPDLNSLCSDLIGM